MRALPSIWPCGSTGSDATRILRIRFVTGRLYDYLHVPREHWMALKAASSKGRYFNFPIRGQYRYQRLTYVRLNSCASNS